MKYWQDLATEMQNKLAMESDSVKQLQERALPTLQEENERARGVINSLQEELNTARQGHAEAHKQLSEQVQSLTDDLQRLSADNAVLRSELAKTVHNKQTTNTKLDLIKKKLGLNESEAKVYIQVRLLPRSYI